METVADDPDANVLTVPIAKVGVVPLDPSAPLGMLKAIVRLDGGPLRLAEAD